MANDKFRSLKEVSRYLDLMRTQLREDAEIVRRGAKQLQAMTRKVLKAAEFDLDFSGGGKAKVKRRRTLKVDFPIVQVPNKDVLTKNYRLAEHLTRQYQTLEQQENEVRITFRDNPAVEKLLGEFAKLKSDVQSQLRLLFTELSNVAAGHAPKEYTHFVGQLAEELNEVQHIECDDIRTFTYVAVNDAGNLVFAGYIVLVNAISDDGNQIPHLYVAVRWTVGEDVEVFVDHDFIQPGQLQGGYVIETVHEATQAIKEQLALEGFSSQLGNLPVEQQLKNGGALTKDAFSAAEYVDKLETAGDQLIFHVLPEGMKRIDELKVQLYAEVKGMLKKKRGSTVKMRITNSSVVFTISGLDHSGGIHPADLTWLEEKYKLSQGQLRRIANEINKGSE